MQNFKGQVLALGFPGNPKTKDFTKELLVAVEDGARRGGQEGRGESGGAGHELTSNLTTLT